MKHYSRPDGLNRNIKVYLKSLENNQPGQLIMSFYMRHENGALEKDL